MINGEASKAFDRIADLLEITGADKFRVNSYRRVSRTLKDLADDLAVIAAEGKLAKLPGIGKSSSEKIQQYVDTGRIDLLDELSGKLPEGLPALLDVPGLGPKKVAQLHKELGIGSVADLKAALEADRIAGLSGFGVATATRIGEGLAFMEKSGGRTALGLALPVAEQLVEQLRAMRGVGRASIAGSLRRGVETVGDVDLVCEAKDGAATVKAFTQLPDVARVLGAGDTKGSISIAIEGGAELRVQVRVVPPESYGAALQYFTGSKEHNVRLREMAGKRGWKLNEWGLFDGEKSIAGKNEEDIYKKLKMPCPPPELREDRFEFDEAFDASKLVSLSAIRGDLHMHTTASDGKNTIEEMALAAKALGYDYIAICDHSKSSAIANGLSIERMEKHIEAIRAVDKQIKGITVLVGCECDILASGELDYPDEILSQCDWVVASVHTAQKGGRVSPTQRTIRAMQNPYVCIIAHPTGRLINRRPPMDLDMAAVTKAAVETHTALEINASWQRLDLKDTHIRQALDAGAMLGINTDAHRTATLEAMQLGVTTARRGGATVDRVVNTMTLGRLKKWTAKKRCSC